MFFPNILNVYVFGSGGWGGAVEDLLLPVYRNSFKESLLSEEQIYSDESKFFLKVKPEEAIGWGQEQGRGGEGDKNENDRELLRIKVYKSHKKNYRFLNITGSKKLCAICIFFNFCICLFTSLCLNNRGLSHWARHNVDSTLTQRLLTS